MQVRKLILPQIKKVEEQKDTMTATSGWNEIMGDASRGMHGNDEDMDYIDKIIDIREYDVPYHIRVAIDNEIRVAFWYDLDLDGTCIKQMTHKREKLDKPDLRVMAFDIETTKAQLKFPDSRVDQVMMISYMIDGKGYLIVNREIISEDI